MGFLSGFEFRTLIAPCDPEVFFAQDWNLRPRVERRGLREFYADLLPVAVIDDVLAMTSQNGNGHEISELDIDAALRRLEQGASLVLSQAQHQIPSLARICRILHAELGFRASADVEVSMPGNKPRPAEATQLHRFVMQIRGRRGWLLDDVPGGAQPDQSSSAPEHILETGDLLYLPPGHVAQHRTTGDESVMATISLQTPRWVDFTGSRALADDPTLPDVLAAPLPPGWIHHPKTELITELSRRWRQAEDVNMIETALDQMIVAEVRGFPLDMRGRLSAVLDPEEIGIATIFGARSDLLWVIEKSGEVHRLVTGPLTIDIASEAQEAVEFCLTADRYSVTDLPSGMTIPDRQALLRRLAQNMLIRKLSA